MELELILILISLGSPIIGVLITGYYWYFGKRVWEQLVISLLGISTLANLVGTISAYQSLPDGQNLELQWISINAGLILGINPDKIGWIMALIASFLGLLIAIFSVEYMSHDKKPTKYWFFLLLFIVGMLILVMGSDFLTTYIGWEMVGLCSFGLISHWYYKPDTEGTKAGWAGVKAFVYTRIGDIGFVVAIVVIYQKIGSINFDIIHANSDLLDNTSLLIIGLSFLFAAFGKSAQFPFIPWLSSPEDIDIDAMQGPTTVSALIHAATMVKAGVYLVARMYLIFPFERVQIIATLVIVLSGVTAIISALSALFAFDLKRILAYSTVSQLAYMFLSLGFAFYALTRNQEEMAFQSFIASQSHLISHALFKSLLFLTAGYLIHTYGSRSIVQMKGTAAWNNDKIAFIGIMIGGLALVGIPPLNGFFSKEAIIGVGFELLLNEFSVVILIGYLFSVFTAIITASYVGRLFSYIVRSSNISTAQITSHLMKGVILIISFLTLIGGIFTQNLAKYIESTYVVHPIDTVEILHLLFMTLVVTLSLLFSYNYPYKIENGYHENITGLSQMLVTASQQGFYLEHIWGSSWAFLRKGTFRLRLFHSGKIGLTLLSTSIVATIVSLFLLGDIL